MDDPWGSPWAEEEKYQQPINTKGHHVASLTTQIPAEATTLKVKEEANSPWDNDRDEKGDDDGFGDWASEPARLSGEGSNREFHSSDEGWQRNARGDGESTDNRARDLSPVWKGSNVFSSPTKLEPSPMPERSIRQPSPDPWATEFTVNQVKPTGNEEVREEAYEDVDTKGHTGEVERQNGGIHTASLDAKTSPLANPLESGSSCEEDEESTRAEKEDAASQEDNTKEARETKRSSTTEAEQLSSRRSSAPSDGSRHDHWPHESPRTSMDEDPKRPQVQRKVSTKVQELVEHFDGLAKHVDEEVEATDRAVSRHDHGNGLEDGTKGSEDFSPSDEEKSDAEVGQADEPQFPVSPSTVSQVSSPISKAQSAKPPDDPQIPRSPSSDTEKFHGPVNFDIDMSILEGLFPNEKSTPVEDIFIPDVVPYDSFSSTGERKTWYRISRYGTMLKHNGGDDENYVRVTWESSTVRDDSLKIVARWMEEDRQSGQVVLGGGNKTSTVFGWGDSKAPPMSLSAAFAANDSKRKPKTFETSTSEEPEVINSRSSLSLPQNGSVMPLPDLDKLTLTPASPVANFGWNSLPESKPGESASIPPPSITTRILPPPTIDIPSPIRTSTSSLRPIPISDTIKPIESPQRTPFAASEEDSNFLTHGVMNVMPNSYAEIQNDDDDEWGDMVSSSNLTSPAFVSSQEDKLINHQHISDAPTKAPTPPPQNQTSVANPPYSRQSSIEIETFDHSITTPSPTNIVSSKAAASVQSIENESWASADLSFFDSTPTPVANPVPVSSAIANSKSSRTVSFSDLPPAQAPHPNQKAREEAEQDGIVQSVVKNLPNLSYMLRR